MKNTIKAISLAALLAATTTVAAAQTQPAPKPLPPLPTPMATPVKAAATTAAPANLPKADDIIDKYVQAIGGAEAIKKQTSRVARGTFEFPAAGITNGVFESYSKAPNKSVTTVQIPGFGEIVEAYDGTVASSSNPGQGVRTKTGKELLSTKLLSDFYRDIKLKELYAAREVRGIEKVNGSDAYAVSLTSADGISTIYYFDTKSNLLVRTDQTIITPEGETKSRVFLSDYRDSDGVKIPFATTIESPQGSFVVKYTEVKNNAAIDDAKFSPKAAQ